MCEIDCSTIFCRIFVQENNYNFDYYYCFVIFILLVSWLYDFIFIFNFHFYRIENFSFTANFLLLLLELFSWKFFYTKQKFLVNYTRFYFLCNLCLVLWARAFCSWEYKNSIEKEEFYRANRLWYIT